MVAIEQPRRVLLLVGLIRKISGVPGDLPMLSFCVRDERHGFHAGT